MKRFPWFEATLVTAILAINLYAALSDAYNFPNAWFTRDDAYYYFKVAQNISEGHGSSFDGINQTNGYHPLWMLVCVPIFALARIDLVLPLRVLVIVMSLLSAATAVLIFRLLRVTLSPPAAILAAAFWAFNPHLQQLLYGFGLEAGIAAFFVILLVVALFDLERIRRSEQVSSRRIAWIGVIAVLAVFSRLDLIFLAALAGLWIIFRGFPLRYLLMLDLPLLFLSMVMAIVLRSGLAAYYSYSPIAAIIGLTALAIKIPALYFSGLYQHPRDLSLSALLRRSSLAISISGLIMAAMISALFEAGMISAFPRSALAVDWGLSLMVVIFVRYAARWFSQTRTARSGSALDELKTNWRAWLKDAAVYYAVIASALGLYMLWNKLAFATFTPVSGQIKYWWGSFGPSPYGGPPRNWLSFFAIDPVSGFDAWPLITSSVSDLGPKLHSIFGPAVSAPPYQALIALLAALIAIILMANPRRVARVTMKLGLPLLAAGSASQVFPYTALAYASVQEWYWISELALTFLTGALIADLLFHWLARLPRARSLALGVSLAWAAYMAIQLGSLVTAIMPHGATPPEVPLMDVVSFLEKNTPPHATIGMTGGGNVGYFIHDRTIVNMDGLINSYDYFLALKAGTGADYLYRHELGYVFANLGLLRTPPYLGQFEGRVVRLTTYGGKSLSILLPAPAGQP